MQADTQWCHETSRGSISNSVPVKRAARPACVQASPPPTSVGFDEDMLTK